MGIMFVEAAPVEKFSAKRLAELQALKLPRLQASVLFTINPPAEGSDPVEAARVMAAAQAYCDHFVELLGKCVCCDSRIGGDGTDFGWMLGTFTWGLATGEGHCGRCNYPARAYHDIPEVGSVRNLILQYHPDDLSFSSKVGG